MPYRTGPNVEDEMADWQPDETRVAFYHEEGREWPLTITAERALRHYGFIAPLDRASYRAFESIFGENWNVEIDWYRSKEEPFEREWDRLIQKEADRLDYAFEMHEDSLREGGW